MQICNFGSRSSIQTNILTISMPDLFWMPNFIKIERIVILSPNPPKFLISDQDPQFWITWPALIAKFHSFIFHSFKFYIFINWKYIIFLGPNFPGMRRLILIFLSNVCYLAVILIFLVVTWWLMLVT